MAKKLKYRVVTAFQATRNSTGVVEVQLKVDKDDYIWGEPDHNGIVTTYFPPTHLSLLGTPDAGWILAHTYLSRDDARWYKFKKELLSDWIESPEQEVLRYALTAPLETISLAAWRVIQEQPK